METDGCEGSGAGGGVGRLRTAWVGTEGVATPLVWVSIVGSEACVMVLGCLN